MPAVPYSRSRSRSRSGSRERARTAKRYRRSSGSRSRSRSSSREDRRRRGRDRSRSRSPSPRTRDERSGDRRGGVAKTDAKRKEAKPSSGGSRNTVASSVASDARKPKPTSTSVRTNENSKKKKQAEDEVADGDTADEEAAAMQALLGFGKFGTTKNRHVEGNNIYVANIVKKRRYRQYMNRRGGFNRPLDAIS